MLAFRVPPRRPFGPPRARPACPVRGPSGPVRGASAVCAAVSAPSRLRVSPRPLPRPFGAAGRGAPSAVRGFVPRPGPWARSAPLRRVGPRPGSVGLGLPARGRARRSGPPSPPPPRRAARAALGVWGGGRGPGPLAPVLCLALRPRGLPAVGLASLRARLGPWRGVPLAGPPLPARPCGAASPSLLRAGGRAPPCGRLSGRFAAPGAYARFLRRRSRSFSFRSRSTSAIA